MTFSSTAPASSSLVTGSNAATGPMPHQHVAMTTRPGSSLALGYSSSSTRDKYTTFLPTPPSSHSQHVPASAAFLEVDNIKQDSIGQESSPLSDLDLDYMHDQGVYMNGLSTRAALSPTLTGTSAVQSERFVLSRDQDTHKTEPLHSEYSKLDPAPTANHSVSSDRDLLPARSSLSSSSSSTTSRPYSNYLTTAHPLPPNHHRYHVDVVQGGRDVNTPYMPVAESFTKRKTSASGAGLRVTFADTERVSYKQMLNGDSPLREQHQMTSSSLSSSVPLNVESTTSLEMRQKTTTPLELPPSDGSRLNSTLPASSSSYRTAYQLAFSTTLPTPSASRNKSDATVLRSASFRQTPTDYRQQELPSFRFNVSNQSPDQASWRSFIQEKSPAINSTSLSSSSVSAKQATLADTKSSDFTVATRSFSRLGSDPLMSTPAAKSEATAFSNDFFVRRSLSKPIGGQGQGQGQGVTGGLLEQEQQRFIGRLDGAAERMANIYNSSSYPFKKDNSASDALHKPAFVLSSSPSRASELQHWSRQPDVLAPMVPSLLDTAAGRNPIESSSLTGGQQQQHWSKTSSNNASLIQYSTAAGRSHSLGRGITSTNSNGWLTDEAEPFEPVTPYSDSTLRTSPKVAITNITLNVSDDYYVKQIQAIVGRTGFVDSPSNYLCSSGPARLLPYLYIGGYREADDLACLRRLGITHVLNCAASDDTSRLQHTHNGKASPYPAGCSVIAYEQFDADDDEVGHLFLLYTIARGQIVNDLMSV
jgi:hypothetical protein